MRFHIAPQTLPASGSLILAVIGALAPVAAGAITNLELRGVTSTQAVIAYTAPDASPCSAEVSDAPLYAPVVHDTDPALFPGANLDSRTSSVSAGRQRRFVAGTRRYQRAADGRIYSRALEAARLHYFRITCGADTATGTFTTATVAFGQTYVDPPQTSSEFAGQLALPTIHDTARGHKIADPLTGAALYYRVSKAGDLDFFDTMNSVSLTGVVAAPNWTNANQVLSAGGGTAGYNGSNCAASCDWINLERTPLSIYPGNSADYVKLHVTGSGTDNNPVHRSVEVCLSFDVVCDGNIKTLVLPVSQGTVSTNAVRGDMWRPAASLSQITGAEITAHGRLRILLRKATSTGSITLDHVTFDVGISAPQNTGSGGNSTLCSDVKDSASFFLCTSNTGGARAVLYRIRTSSGADPDIRYLGYLPNLGGFQCTVVGFSPSTASRMYCQAGTTAYQLDYTGDGTDKAPPYTAEISSTVLSTDFAGAVKTFVTANLAHYPFAFDDTKFVCSLSTPPIVQGDYIQMSCRRGGQDSYAWLAVWRLGAGVVAAYPSWAHPSSRWCAHHSFEEIGQQNNYLWTTQQMKGGVGAGPYTTTLAAGIASGSETIIHVTSEPVSPSADTFLMDVAPGDTVRIDSEYMYVAAKLSGTAWVVSRGAGGTAAAAHSTGATVTMTCATAPGGSLYEIGTPMIAWDYIGDPWGESAPDTYVWANHYVGHMTARKNRAVNNNGWAEAAAGTDLIARVKNFAYPYSVTQQPAFAGRIPPAAGISYQTHPTWHNVTGEAFSQGIFADTRPLIGGNLMSESSGQDSCNPALLLPAAGGCAAQRQPGTSDVYKYSFSGSDRPQASLAYHQMPIYAIAGKQALRNVSGPGSSVSDLTPYVWCYALLAGECRSGSSPGDLFVVAPAVNKYYCTGGESFNNSADLCVMERAAGTLSATEHSTEVKHTGVFRSRDLLGINSIATTARYSSGASVKHLPDGSGILVTVYRAERDDVFLVIAPPYVADTVNRETFVPQRITISSVPDGASRVLVKFGYNEDFICSENRNEACYAGAAAVDENSPFQWQSQLSVTSGTACPSGCAIAIPAVAGRLVWYQIVYRDATGNTIHASPVEVAAAP